MNYGEALDIAINVLLDDNLYADVVDALSALAEYVQEAKLDEDYEDGLDPPEVGD